MATSGGAIAQRPMTDSSKIAKTTLRFAIRERLSKVSMENRANRAANACQILIGQPRWKEARFVLLYAPLRDELNVDQLLKIALESGKILALPRYSTSTSRYDAAEVRDLEEDLRPGRFAVREPGPTCRAMPLNRLDFILVPGVAFTLDGRRLGRGKGHYDMLLANSKSFRCGVAFDQQIVEDLPTEAHDIRLDCILTPTRWCPVDPRAVLK